MRFGNQSSWRFEEDDAQMLHLALFTRDAAGLAVPPSADTPPPLVPDAPRRPGLVLRDEAAAVAAQWADLWGRLVRFQVSEARLRREEDSNEDMLASLRRLAERQQRVFDPPDFESLAIAAELRRAVVATFEDGLAWFNRPKANGGQRPQRDSFDYQVVRNAAQSAATDSGESLQDMDAVVHVLDVEGSWSYLAGPGCALCSTTAAADPATADLLLRQVFGSRFQ